MAKKSGVNISNKFDINTYLMQSSMKYNQKGQMMFDDALYLTQWLCKDAKMISETLFTRAQTESFNITTKEFDEPIEWSQFGFVQNFDDILTGEYCSPLHRNTHLELYYVVDGEFKIKVHNRIVTLTKGESLILNQNTLHSDILGNRYMDLRIIGLNKDYFDADFYRVLPECDLTKMIKSGFDRQHQDSEYWKFDSSLAVGSIIEAMGHELRLRDLHYEAVLKAQTARLFDLLIKTNVLEKREETSKGFKALVFNEVDRYIQEYHATITLNDLSHFMKFSKDYFNRLIKEMTGQTYVQYLQKVRIEKALVLLDESNESVSEIAVKVGYQNTSHFYEIFKSQVGLTPNEYRLKRF